MILIEVVYGEKFTDLIEKVKVNEKTHLSIPKQFYINLKEDKIDLIKYAEYEIIKNIYCDYITDRGGDLIRKKVNLGDIIIYKYNNILSHGIVKAITWRGVNISTNYGDRFFKWCHILEIHKK